NELRFEQIEEDFSTAQLEPTVAGSIDSTAAAIRSVALLVCDIRGFSTIAEKISSSDLAQHLGIWFREAGNLVNKNGGIVDKFIGDALLAYWGGCESDSADCAATLRIASELLALDATANCSDGQPFRVGIALHYGIVTCGNFGLD